MAAQTPSRSGPRPRVDTRAPYEATRAPEAIEWAAKTGLIPDDWQADALHGMLAVHPSGKWVHFEVAEWVSRQNGKGSILEIRALAGLFVFGEELIMWSAHEYKTAMEAFRRCLKLLRRIGTQVGNNENLIEVDGHTVKVSNTNGEEGFELLDTKQRLKFIARSKGSGRGFSGDVNIIDEAFAYTNVQQEALLFTVGARPNPQIIYTSSPPLDGITGDVMYALRLRGDPTGPREFEDGPWRQDPELAYRDWGLPGDLEDLSHVDFDDRALWKTTNPSLNVIRADGASALTTLTIERERRAFRGNLRGFARERFGVWPKRVRDGGGVIPLELWQALATNVMDAGRPEDVAFAVVVAADRSYTTIAAVGPQDDGRLQASIVAYERGTEWVVDRMVELHNRWNPITWVIEDKGSTASLWPEIERRTHVNDGRRERTFDVSEDVEKPHRGEIAVPWSHDVAAAYGLLIDAVVQKRLAHLSDAPLDAAVACAQARPLGTGATWDHRGDVETSPLRGITNALWGYRKRADRIVVANPWEHVY